MVIGAFPIFKLSALLVKQISKPIANAVKERAKTHPFFRKYFCMPPAQFYNWCEVQTKMWILNLGKPVSVPILNEAMAIELGANLVGEGVIFIVAAAILISEYSRSSRKEAAKDLEKIQEMQTLQSKISELYFQTETQAAQIRELTRTLGSLETRAVVKPWTKPPEAPPPATTTTPDVKPPPPPPLFPISNEAASSGDIGTSDQPNPNVSTTRVDADVATVLPPRETSTLLQAVSVVESEFWHSPQQRRNDGVIVHALDYIVKEVYRLPMTVR